MIANTDNISSILNVTNNIPDSPSTIPTTKPILINSDNGETKVENDYEYARKNLYDLIDKGQYALDDLMEIARQAQHPRAFEVVSGMLNNLVIANEKLINLSKQLKDIKGKEEEKKVTNNNLFVGSTAELLTMIKGK